MVLDDPFDSAAELRARTADLERRHTAMWNKDTYTRVDVINGIIYMTSAITLLRLAADRLERYETQS